MEAAMINPMRRVVRTRAEMAMVRRRDLWLGILKFGLDGGGS